MFLELDEVWACEAAERLTYVHSSRGRFDLDLTLSAIAQSFGRTLLRVQRNWLINPARVLKLERLSGETTLLVGVPARVAMRCGSPCRVTARRQSATS